jgi:hypothetical protein
MCPKNKQHVNKGYTTVKLRIKITSKPSKYYIIKINKNVPYHLTHFCGLVFQLF